MALIMYLNRAPRYDGITAKDIKLVESYYAWKKERALDGPYSCNTLEEWCGVPESEMPHKHAVNYLLDFMSPKTMYIEGIGKQERESIFEQMGRIANAPHILKWFVDNIMNGNTDAEYHEITGSQLAMLLRKCSNLSAKEGAAKETLPLPGDVIDDDYNECYMSKITETIEVLNYILGTTDFEKQAVYFNVIFV